jgi:hypothetical protein
MARKSKKRSSVKRRMNHTAILSFYNHRSLRGDNARLSEETGYSESHISNVKAGRRRINDTIANAMYYISRRRAKQVEA